MASQIDVANRALSKIGEAQILSFADNSKPARAISSAFAMIRDSELRRHTWSFSVTRAQLAADATPPDTGYSNRYALPADCLRVLQVGDFHPAPSESNFRNGPDAEWAIEGRWILTDPAGPLTLRYVASITDTGQWDSLFAMAVSCALGAELADELSASLQRKESVKDDYREIVRDAIRANAIELPPSSISDDTWVTCRVRG